MRRPSALAATLALIALARPGMPVRAQAPAPAAAPAVLPKAETVLQQFIEATGGLAAYEKVKNRRLTATMELVGAGIKGNVTVTQAAPDRLLRVTEFGPLGKIVEGTDGRSAWLLSPIAGDRLLEGAEKDVFLSAARFDKDYHWKEAYRKVECTGIEDVDGKPAYKVVLTPKAGRPVTQFYDKASHLQVKETTVQAGPMGSEVTVEVYPADFRTVDGIIMPFAVSQKVRGQTIAVQITELKHNVDIPADTFKRPASLDGAEK